PPILSIYSIPTRRSTDLTSKFDGMSVFIHRSIIVVIANATLLIDERLDDRRRKPSRQSAVLAAFEEDCHHDVGIAPGCQAHEPADRKSTRLNSSHLGISY